MSVATVRRRPTGLRRRAVNRTAEEERARILPPAARSDSAQHRRGIWIDLKAADRPRGGEPERLGDILDRLFAACRSPAVAVADDAEPIQSELAAVKGGAVGGRAQIRLS